ncbi:MAG TPA: DUF3857 domain-containing protein [Bacteroidota bacterium]
MKKLLTALFIIPTLLPGGTKPEYGVSAIPASLRNDASAVVRRHIQHFEVNDREEATYTLRRAVTIFDKNDRDYGEIVVWYGGNTEIENLEGYLYDAEGNEIRELEDTDTKDYAAFGVALYTDTRVRVASLFHDKYPYTVEFIYELSYDGFISWPRWLAQRYIDPVELSRFEVKTSEKTDLRFWCNRDTVHPEIRTDGGSRFYTWEARNLEKIDRDVVGDVEDITTIVEIAPEQFSLEGFDGSMRSWEEFGKWYATLSAGKDHLPAAAADEIRKLVEPNDHLRAKIVKVYRFMQSRTRYISVQLGIGGWQPFDAVYVHERGYGDCKALSNYMKALLETVGITAYPVLINNGTDRFPMIREFPSNQFNHVILAVPLERDTMWLECTSQSIPAGLIGYGNENRSALLIGPNGGVIVQTPVSPPEANAQKRAAIVVLASNGQAACSMTTILSGNQQDRVRRNLDDATPREREDWLLKDLQISHVNMKSFSVEGLETKAPTITVTLNLTIPRFGSVSGNRVFFRPNLTERISSPPADVPIRLSPVRLNYVYADFDSVCYILPEGYFVEALPERVFVEQPFGRFESRTHVSGDSAIVFTRSLTMTQHEIPADQYATYRSFFIEIFKADKAQAVLLRKSAQ